MNAATIITIAKGVVDIAAPIIKEWRESPKASVTELTAVEGRFLEAARKLLEPIMEDGFQVGDLFRIQQPAMELFTLVAGSLDLPDHPSDLEELGLPADHPTKWGTVLKVYQRILDNWDPEVDFTFSWWAKPVEGIAEEAADDIIVKTAREIAPDILEQGLLSARAKWPEYFSR